MTQHPAKTKNYPCFYRVHLEVDAAEVEAISRYGLQYFPAGELTIGGVEPSRFFGPITYAPRLDGHVTYTAPPCDTGVYFNAKYS